MAQPKKILFLYTELAGYTLACMDALAETGADVHVIHYPVNKEAPFQFSFSKKIHFYERKGLDREGMMKLAEEIAPDLIVCSGWIDRDYVFVYRKMSRNVPAVLALDNQWKGNFRQRIASPIVGRTC